MDTFDVIVVGTGGVGSAALLHLARQGVRVLGLDQFPPAHHRGSSHGQTRIIRQAYFEHPDYVPLLRRAYQLWDELEQAAGKQLFYQVGLLEVGPADGILIPGILESVRQHAVLVETLEPADARARYPFLIPDNARVLLEPSAGYLLVEQCVQTHLSLAATWGASWRQQRVVGWRADVRGVVVETDAGSYASDKLVLCGGAWSASLVASLGVPLRILAKNQYWLAPHPSLRNAHTWPTYFFETPDGCYYGFPAVDDRGPKVARHTGGTEWSQPQDVEGFRCAEDERLVRKFLAATLPPASQLPATQEGCMYTVSPDEQFIVDHHPDHPRVCFAAGLSGHGFKFTPVLGEILCDLALKGHSTAPIEFLNLGRFGKGETKTVVP